MSYLIPNLKGLNSNQHRYLKIHDKKYSGLNKKIKRPALILDRDGVVIKEKNYLFEPSKVELEEGAVELMKKANKMGWKIIIVTNQSGISRGFFNWKEYEEVSLSLLNLIGKNDLINGIYANSYGPDAGEETWRKPSPKMIFKAASDLSLDLSKSILIGDRLTDIISGARAGLKTLIHVESGHGKRERKDIEQKIITSKNINKQQDKEMIFTYNSKEVAIKLISSLKFFEPQWLIESFA